MSSAVQPSFSGFFATASVYPKISVALPQSSSTFGVTYCASTNLRRCSVTQGVGTVADTA
jgi:hypothetical protein